MAILEAAAVVSAEGEAAAPYRAHARLRSENRKEVGIDSTLTAPHAARKLTIEEIWERGKRLGLATANESVRIIRKSRDARYGR